MTLIHSMLQELDQEAQPTRRLLERVLIPSIYGPSADENPFAV